MRRLLLFSIVAFCTLFYCGQVSGQTISTYAGGLGSGTATNLAINVSGVAPDNAGNIYITDGKNNLVWKVTNTGIASVIAGIGGANAYGGDGGQATAAQFSTPNG